MSSFAKGWDRLLGVLGSLSGLLYASLIITICVDLTTRLTTGRSVPGLLEAAEVAMVTAVALALGPAEADGSHVRTGLLLDRLSERLSRTLLRIGSVLPIIVTGIFVYALFAQASTSLTALEVKPGIVPVPVYPAKIAFAIGMTLFLVEYVRTSFFRREIKEDVLV